LNDETFWNHAVAYNLNKGPSHPSAVYQQLLTVHADGTSCLFQWFAS